MNIKTKIRKLKQVNNYVKPYVSEKYTSMATIDVTASKSFIIEEMFYKNTCHIFL